MKLLLCVHGYPPELLGGTEEATRRLAEGLARRGHEVLVLAGSLSGAVPGELLRREESRTLEGARHPLRVLRWTRGDLYFDHWHKSQSAPVARCFRELLERERPDLVHVQHWLRLSRDLVRLAAQAGVPAVCSLHDSWVSCPLVLRVESAGGAACERPLAPGACIACAGRVAPRTPWVALDAAYMAFAQRTQDIASELALARARLVPTRAFGERQRAYLREAGLELDFEVLAPAAPPTFAATRVPPAAPSPGAPLRLGSWGQLSHAKGTDLLFEALAGLGPTEPIELVLAGGEPREGYVEDLRARFPAARVRFEGPFDARELDRHPVSAVHAMVSAPRAAESFGLVLDEARALGLPALLSDQGALAERGGEARGALLFTHGSADALRAALRRLLREPQLLETLRRALPAPVSEAQVLDGHLEVYARAQRAGAPADVAPSAWFAERLVDFDAAAWDRSLSERSAEELGFEDGRRG